MPLNRYAIVFPIVFLFVMSLATVAWGQDYGWKNGDQASGIYWTRLDDDGKSAWRKKVVEVLTARGFTDLQIKKFSRLNILLEHRERVSSGVEFDAGHLPVRYNPETGRSLSLEPEAYALALPDCFQLDERNCNLRYSMQEEEGYGKKPCLIPHRTRLFCKRVGFVNHLATRWDVNRPRLDTTVTVKRYAPSCGEDDRGSGCGASEVLFDFAEASTKLAFNIKAAEKTAKTSLPILSLQPSSANRPSDKKIAKDTPSSTPKPVPRIVYTLGPYANFVKREGPPEYEEWEPNFAAKKAYDRNYARLQKDKDGVVKDSDKFQKLLDRLQAANQAALKYCWPHDVLHPCDLD